jgi:acyl-homoserine lactone acylase PvdQ
MSLAATGTAAARTAPTATPTAVTDYCQGQCNDILPPGENGNATLADILAHKVFGTRPGHAADQLDRYANLLNSYLGLSNDQIGQFFNSGALGVPLTQLERVDRPRSDVTIERDRATGVPHIFGTTRSGTMFGAGYAGAQDRLFVMDLLRHLGRGQLSGFAGGAPGNRALEQSVWRNSPYREADLQAQIDALRAGNPQLYTDMQDYLAGINAYIGACMAGRYCPGEYVLSGHLNAITNAGGPQPFVPTDLVATAGVVGGLFGGGGGAEMQSALVRVAARARYGVSEGDRVWAAFREQNDPETVLTLHNGQSFPYGAAPADQSGVALPDAGTTALEPVVYDATGSAGAATAVHNGLFDGLRISPQHQGMSNAVVVSGKYSTTGHPIAVFGPQTGYFSPQLLMLEELEGPGISARGVSFAGLNLYVQIGRGPDYAWSATSAEQDITDTYATPLCTVDGSPVTTKADHYLYHGQCLAMDVLSQTDAWTPTVADGTAAGSYRLQALRTRYGLVQWRGLVGGKPVAFTSLRSTYRHEADVSIGFAMFDDPAQMRTAAGFQQAASHIGYAFNWFYVNASDAAYYNSGLNPVRSPVADPNLPVKADPATEWQDWNPDTNVARYTAFGAHPNSVNQDYYVSWNNKQAYDYGAADGNFSFGPVFRADLLDAPVRAALHSGQKLDRPGVLRIAEDAAATDLRGRRVLGELLRVLTSAPVTDPALAPVVAQLSAWQQSGAYLKETGPGSHAYQNAAAIRVFDAWWPLLAGAEFRPGLGDGLFQSLAATLTIDESPSANQAHHGSAFQSGWWGYVDKDLRTVLGDPVAGPLPHAYCGGGTVAGCRQVLLDSLRQAAATPATTVYPGDGTCAAGDQWCADSIVQSALGGITDPPITWQNRPTYQQVVSFPASR